MWSKIRDYLKTHFCRELKMLQKSVFTFLKFFSFFSFLAFFALSQEITEQEQQSWYRLQLIFKRHFFCECTSTQKTLKKSYEKINNFSNQIPDILYLIWKNLIRFRRIRPCPNKIRVRFISFDLNLILIVFFRTLFFTI